VATHINALLTALIKALKTMSPDKTRKTIELLVFLKNINLER